MYRSVTVIICILLFTASAHLIFPLKLNRLEQAEYDSWEQFALNDSIIFTEKVLADKYRILDYTMQITTTRIHPDSSKSLHIQVMTGNGQLLPLVGLKTLLQ